MKTKTLVSVFLVAILIPQVALAAWWNPFSWFSKLNVEQEKPELLQRLVELEKQVNSQDVASSTIQESPKLEVKEKIITQTITVDNPELQKKINALITENITLQAKINSQSSLVEQLNSCRADLTEMKGATKVNTADSAVEEKIRERLLEIDEQILAKIDRYLVGASSDTITFNDGSTSISLILGINQLLDSYRVVDTKMAHKNLPTDIKTFKEGVWYVLDLKNYLVNSYIKYR